MNDIEQYQWKSRLLLLFAPSGDNAEYLEQQRLLEGREAELAERETLVMQFVESAHLPDAAAARERFGITPDTFTLVLVGKDGTAKRIEHTPVALDAIFSLIDSMPMRQQEIAG